MITIYSEEYEWITHEGKKIKLKDLTDDHLANILHWKKECLGEEIWNDPLYDILLKMVKDRGLMPEYLDRAQIPYRNKRGKWEIFKDGVFMEVSK